MTDVNKTVVVCQEADDFMTKITALTSVIAKQVKDGYQPVLDLPIDIVEAVKDLVPAVADAQTFGANLSANKVSFAKAMELGLTDLTVAVIG